MLQQLSLPLAGFSLAQSALQGGQPLPCGRRSTPWTEERFMARVSKQENGCWHWNRSLTPEGYGSASVAGVGVLAHRLAWILFRGAIGPELFVCHVCDVRQCVNPAHLFVGTGFDNMRDAARKGRTLSGEANPRRRHAKLTRDVAEQIRARRAHGEAGLALAEEFGISEGTVCDIYKGRTWW